MRFRKIIFFSRAGNGLSTGCLAFGLRLFFRFAAFADFDTPAAGLSRRRGHSYFKHAVAKSCVGFFAVYTAGYGNLSIKAAIASLGAVIAFFVFFLFLSSLPPDLDRIIGD